MRIKELCGNCKHFEHECTEEMCFEYCYCPKERTRERFYEEEGEITKCGDFEANKW